MDESSGLFLRLDTKLDSLSEKVSDLVIVSIKQESNLQVHMQRTSLAEARLDNFENDVRPILEGLRFFKHLGTFAVGFASVLKAISLFWK